MFWEERNVWYSDIWTDIKGTDQKLSNKTSRLRSGAFPYNLAYRLINMYSVKEDVILDPFLGTGTTIAAAMTSGRSSIGVEIDESLKHVIFPIANNIISFSNDCIHERLLNHIKFVENRIDNSAPLKYISKYYGFPVMTSQERYILLNEINKVQTIDDNTFEVAYSQKPQTLDFEQIPESMYLNTTKHDKRYSQLNLLEK